MAAGKKALLACPVYWTSPLQYGSHHLARQLVKSGFEAAYVSDPICPAHRGLRGGADG
jgi:hypothetical protein